AFIDRIHTSNCKFICSDFRQIDVNIFNENDFVYADPPYLITCAAYNENDGWTEHDECDLLKFLDSIHASGIRFALSNVLSSKGKRNNILTDWLKSNANRYTVIHLKHSYANSNYHKTDKSSESDEVLVVNYDFEQGR
ncbi:MAG: DNA adenine methylase, partial [Selenomonadaceae bacterium]|nr:DNA adenine methylase [Selenomonadaceae bacterium]